MSLFQFCKSLRDPTTAAVLMEDAAACTGVVIAGAGIATAQITGMPVFDSMAGISVACLLGSMGLYLARLNQKYLVGHAVEPSKCCSIRDMGARVDKLFSVIKFVVRQSM